MDGWMVDERDGMGGEGMQGILQEQGKKVKEFRQQGYAGRPSKRALHDGENTKDE